MKTLYHFFWRDTMKTFLISTAAACLTLCMGVSAQGSYTYTALDVPGADHTHPYGIDGSNIVGSYSVSSEEAFYGFLAVIPEPATLSLLAMGMLMACRRRR